MSESAKGGGDRPEPAWLPAFGVHVFTALGAGIALLAMLAAAKGDFVAMFWWLGAALFVDGIDGTVARRFRVAEALPRWSGDTLDFVVDFTTYVFVPAYAIATCGLLPAIAAVPIAIVIVVTSAIYFADRDMKLEGNYFRGFPALWNAAAFYLILVKPSPWVGAVALAVFVVATFLPIRTIHPFRVARFQTLNIVLLAVWAALGAFALHRDLDPGFGVTALLVLIGGYFVLGGHLAGRKI